MDLWDKQARPSAGACGFRRITRPHHLHSFSSNFGFRLIRQDHSHSFNGCIRRPAMQNRCHVGPSVSAASASLLATDSTFTPILRCPLLRRWLRRVQAASMTRGLGCDIEGNSGACDTITRRDCGQLFRARTHNQSPCHSSLLPLSSVRLD